MSSPMHIIIISHSVAEWEAGGVCQWICLYVFNECYRYDCCIKITAEITNQPIVIFIVIVFPLVIAFLIFICGSTVGSE